MVCHLLLYRFKRTFQKLVKYNQNGVIMSHINGLSFNYFIDLIEHFRSRRNLFPLRQRRGRSDWLRGDRRLSEIRRT